MILSFFFLERKHFFPNSCWKITFWDACDPGGTFVIDGASVLFAHADKFPGDHPAIADVLRAARIEILDSSGAGADVE